MRGPPPVPAHVDNDEGSVMGTAAEDKTEEPSRSAIYAVEFSGGTATALKERPRSSIGKCRHHRSFICRPISMRPWNHRV